MNHYTVRNFKVVEPNNLVALRSGHIIAQAKLEDADYLTGSTTAEFVENGVILFLDIDGQLKTKNKIDAATVNLVPLLHFTEELMTGPMTDLKYFAVGFDNHIAYPRALALYVGDSFTTNNYVIATENPVIANADCKYAIVNANGVLEASKTFPVAAVADYYGPIFSVVPNYLPDGVTAALEFTVINPMAHIAVGTGN